MQLNQTLQQLSRLQYIKTFLEKVQLHDHAKRLQAAAQHSALCASDIFNLSRTYFHSDLSSLGHFTSTDVFSSMHLACNSEKYCHVKPSDLHTIRERESGDRTVAVEEGRSSLADIASIQRWTREHWSTMQPRPFPSPFSISITVIHSF